VQIYDVALIPLIIGLVQVLKYFGFGKKWFLPLASLLFGVLAGVIYVNPYDVKEGILIGLLMGLSASGMYSGGKAILEKEE
jgi:hypothetical protein